MDINVALQVLLALLAQADKIRVLFETARAEGRTDLTDEEVASIAGQDDAARARLQALIDSIPKP